MGSSTSSNKKVKIHKFFPIVPPFFIDSFKPRSVMEGTVSSESLEKEENVINLEQISLRPLELSDLDDFMVWATDEKVAKYCTWEPYTSKKDGINFIKSTSQVTWFRAICLNNHAIGSVSVRSYSGNEEWRARTAGLGYALGSKYWGKGIVTHVVKLATKTVFSELPQLLRLEAMVDVENVGSQRVLEKAGFHREGVLRNYAFLKGRRVDIVMFSLLPADSKP